MHQYIPECLAIIIMGAIPFLMVLHLILNERKSTDYVIDELATRLQQYNGGKPINVYYEDEHVYIKYGRRENRM